MPTYEFTCSSCGQYQHHETKDPIPDCASCGKQLTRKFAFFSPKPWQPGFNHSIGRFVDSREDFQRGLKEIGVRESERFGIESTWVEVGPSDATAAGVTEELPKAVEEKWHKQRAE